MRICTGIPIGGTQVEQFPDSRVTKTPQTSFPCKLLRCNNLNATDPTEKGGSVTACMQLGKRGLSDTSQVGGSGWRFDQDRESLRSRHFRQVSMGKLKKERIESFQSICCVDLCDHVVQADSRFGFDIQRLLHENRSRTSSRFTMLIGFLLIPIMNNVRYSAS
jgi:hypothetical protein